MMGSAVFTCHPLATCHSLGRDYFVPIHVQLQFSNGLNEFLETKNETEYPRGDRM